MTPVVMEHRRPAAGATGRVDDEPRRAATSIRTAAWFGLLAGSLELAVVLARRAIDSRITMDSLRTNRHFVWMIPLSNALIFAALGLALAGLSGVWPRAARRLPWRVYPALAALALLLTVPGLYLVASVVLACGIGSCAGAFLERRAAVVDRAARVGLPVLAVVWGVAAVVWVASLATAERRALARIPPAPAGSPNVLLVVLDNVRAESLGLYGHDRPTSPNLDRLAREGIVFTEARSTAPWTLPSHASMFTGQWPHRLSVGWDRALDDAHPTLAEYLAGHGYATAGFVGNTYYCNARYGLDRGFARYDDYYENQAASPFEVVHSSGLGRSLLRMLGYTVKVEEGGTALRKTAAMLHRDVLGWLADRPRGRPFFVFLNDFDAHSPFIPPDGPDPRFGTCALPRERQVRILKRYQRLMVGKARPEDGPRDRIEREATDAFRDGYESCIAYLDRQLGLLFDGLDRLGLRENTLVIVTSDHGEHFKEHGFFGHGLSLYRREVHVPLVVFPPTGRRGATAPRVVAEPVSLRDLPATVVDVLGLAGSSPFPGRSLAATWTPGASAADSPAPLLCEVGHQKRFPPMSDVPATLGPLKSIVADGKVYIRHKNQREELYDLLGDRHERHNLVELLGTGAPVEHYRTLMDQALAGDPW